MKQILIFLLILILAIIGYGQYSKYKRYHSKDANYSISSKVDNNYHNQEVVFKYYKAIEGLNRFVKLQWTANEIDVKAPEYDNNATSLALDKYAEKLAIVKFYENKLEASSELKQNGLSNFEIKHLEETGTKFKAFQENLKLQKIKSLFDPVAKIKNGDKNPLIFEVQKRLNTKGFNIQTDGIFKEETKSAIRDFETKNNLFPDGYIDILTLDVLFK